MTIKFELERTTRLVLVEGEDDREFFSRLLTHIESNSESPQLVSTYEILTYEGRDKLAGFLYQLAQQRVFHGLTDIGIVRDSDFNTDALESIRSSLRTANRQLGREVYSIPNKVLTRSSVQPYIMPLTIPINSDGTLERLLVNALQSDAVMNCVDKYISCVSVTQHADIAENRLDKNKLRVFVAGKAVNKNAATNEDTKRNHLRNIFSMTWLPPSFWHHPAFDDAKEFLTQLLEN